MKYLLLILIFSSCSSLTRQECVGINWYVKGLADGQDGSREPKTKEYREACYSHNVNIKSFDYLKGFEDGSKTYCTSDNAKVLGSRGERPHKICEEINPDFKPSYQKGLRTFLKTEAKEELLEKYGMECHSNSNCKDGKSCRSVKKITRFNDHITIRVCR